MITMTAIYNTPTNEQASEVRKIAKSFGVKKCRKSAHYIYAGSQIERVTTQTAHKMMDAFKAAGYLIDCETTCRELADKGLFDVCMVAKIVS